MAVSYDKSTTLQRMNVQRQSFWDMLMLGIPSITNKKDPP